VLHKHFADNQNARSTASRLRRRRFQILLGMILGSPDPVTILDIGGRPEYWQSMTAGLSHEQEIRVTLLNLERLSLVPAGFAVLEGDARSLPQLGDQSFDIVFSNSTIEHVGGFSDQASMAREVRRIGKRYCVQTPNRSFPIEPHFVFPFFHFLPFALRTRLVQHFDLGWYKKLPKREDAEREVRSIRLLSRGEMVALFPEATIFNEIYLGLVKSFVAFTPTSD
jgi:hypothetical protein